MTHRSGSDPSQSDVGDLGALRRLTVASVLLAVVIAVPSTYAFVAAFGFDVEAAIFGDPAAILGRGPEAAALLHWGALGDMLYSYLLLVPLALYLHRKLRPRKPWLADLGTAGAFAYIFVGASSAAILATVGPSLIEAYAAAAPVDRQPIAISYGVMRDVVFFALWQTLDAITAGTWVLSVGWLILPENRARGLLLMAFGVAGLALGLQTVLGLHRLSYLAAGVAVPLAIWAGWLILDRLSQRERLPR